MRHEVELTPDHPGFWDTSYRARRDAIAALARTAVRGCPAPEVEYTEEEHSLWSALWSELEPLHAASAFTPLRCGATHMSTWQKRIPQLFEVSRWLDSQTGFRLEPVPGLIPSHAFFLALGEGVFLCTQYIRHPSRPHYTPEPDIVHELMGHAASLAHAELAALNRLFGHAARRADAATLLEMERVYWYTLEFGLVREQGTLKALGAGLLSSVEELRGVRGDGRKPALKDWDLTTLRRTPYRTDCPQEALFVASSFGHICREISDWLACIAGSFRKDLR